MKYLLIFIGWIGLALLLIIGKLIKLARSLTIIAWHFRFKKEDHTFWKWHSIYFPLFTFYDFCYSFTLRDYFMVNWKVLKDPNNLYIQWKNQNK